MDALLMASALLGIGSLVDDGSEDNGWFFELDWVVDGIRE